MVKKLFVFLVATMLMVGIAQAQDRGTPAEAKAMVKKAVAFIKEAGKDRGSGRI